MDHKIVKFGSGEGPKVYKVFKILKLVLLTKEFPFSHEVVDELYKKMYDEHTKEVIKVFDEHFEQIKETGIFNYNASIDQYKWIFADRVADMDRRNMFTKDSDYPKILSCGARGLVFGLEAPTPKGACGQTPTYLNNHTLWARDLWMIKGYSSNQHILRDKKTAQTVIDVYNGIIDDNKEELYAYLIKNNILVKDSGVLKTNIAYLNKEFLELIRNINNNLYAKLEKPTCEIKEYLTKVVSKSIPSNLKEYTNGYVITLMQFFAGNKIIEALIENKFLTKNNIMDEFVELTRQHDTWEWKNIYNNEKARKLAILFDSLGTEGYINFMYEKLNTEKEFNFNNIETVLINNKKLVINDAIQGYLKNIYYREILGMKAGIIFINYEFRNEIAEYLRENKYDIDFVMMISIDRGVISYRSTKKNVSVRKVAEFYNGKGHDAAATNPITSRHKELILDILTKK